MSDDAPCEPDGSYKSHGITMNKMGCGDCGQMLEPHRQATKIEGASPRVVLLCPGCLKAIVIIVKSWRPVQWLQEEGS